MTEYNELRDGQEFYGNGYKKGYEDAKKEYARPKGEWIPLYPRTVGEWEYKCNKCGRRNIMNQENFCPSCGADMRKGDKNGKN